MCYDRKVMDYYWDTLSFEGLQSAIAERGNFERCEIRKDQGWNLGEHDYKWKDLPARFNLNELKFNDLEGLSRKCRELAGRDPVKL